FLIQNVFIYSWIFHSQKYDTSFPIYASVHSSSHVGPYIFLKIFRSQFRKRPYILLVIARDLDPYRFISSSYKVEFCEIYIFHNILLTCTAVSELISIIN
ncbi:hypothetical protein L9F63_016912, partial [Diploptera punctata]